MSILDRRANDYATEIDKCRTVADATDLYADALAFYGPDGIRWATVNGAVLRRWSKSTLDRIKRAAWKRCKEQPR